MNAFDAVHSTIREELQGIGPLPPLINETVDLLSKGHLYYRAYKMGSAFESTSNNPSQGNALVYGAALHLVADHTSLNFALTLALVAKCAEDLLREYRELSENCQSFWDAVDCRYPVYQPVDWRREEGSPANLFLPSSLFAIQIKLIQLVSQIKKIISCALVIVWQTFKLSMSTADAYLILQGDQSARFEGFTHLVASWDLYKEQLGEDQARLIEEIESESGIANRILGLLGLSESCIDIIAYVKNQDSEREETFGGILEDLQIVGKAAVNSVVIPGKLSSKPINFLDGDQTPPALPKGRFPPWAGQNVPATALPQPKPVDPSPNPTALIHHVFKKGASLLTGQA